MIFLYCISSFIWLLEASIQKRKKFFKMLADGKWGINGEKVHRLFMLDWLCVCTAQFKIVNIYLQYLYYLDYILY